MSTKFTPPHIDTQRWEPLFDLIDHLIGYVMCCCLIGAVLYLALEQVR